MKSLIKKITPKPIWKLVRIFYFKLFKKIQYRIIGRSLEHGETEKAKGRRLREGFFEKYCQGKGLDVGFGGDLLSENCRGWDYEHGDARYLYDIKDSTFDFVYSSHLLEEIDNPDIALKTWYRVLKPRGYLILYLPDRELFEKRKTLPSRWNICHKRFFLLDRDDPPDTIGIIPLIQRTLSDFKIIYAKECKEGHTIADPEIRSDGEYSIEVVLKKEYGT